jgi:sporulation protein YlmC with PRC-barrel domain
MNKKNQGRLVELRKSNFEIVKGDADIRGWKVKDLEGRRIGDIQDLILDPVEKKVRYMVVDLDKNDFKWDDKKVLIPIGLAEIHRKDDDVILPNVNAAHIGSIPEYDHDRLDGNYERQICYSLGMAKDKSHVEGLDPEPEFYKHDYYNDDNLYRHRLKENSEKEKVSEFEKGLRLWEKRSEGGILPDNHSREKTTDRSVRTEMEARRHEKETMVPASDERRSEKSDERMSEKRTVSEPKNKKDRASGGRNGIRPGKSIEDRIRREGLRDQGSRE